MGYSNTTTHYSLPQYVATDKPKYLTDFNETMVAIDTQMYTNAQAAATADGKAVAAKEVADGAVSSIGTLNAQINGDPEDPTDTGLNGQVSDNKTDIETMQALIGNGTPTTSNQTIIGAINGLEGAVAPREDGDNLANGYNTGEQFARGGSIYTALTDLTANTPFASLTLNTDYKVSDTLVEQIADVVGEVSEIKEDLGVTIRNFNEFASVTGDGVKTSGELMAEAISAFMSAVANIAGAYIEITNIIWYDLAALCSEHNVYDSDTTFTITNTFHATNINLGHTNLLARDVDIVNGVVTDAAQCITTFATNETAYIDASAEVPSVGVHFGIHYRVYNKKLV